MKLKLSPSRTDRWWDISAAILLWLVLTMVASRLVATEWIRDLITTRTIVYLGLIAGLALGQSNFSPRKVAFFTSIYGTFTVIWRLGVTMGEGVLWSERLLGIAGRMWVIFTQLFTRQPVMDTMLFLMLMTTLFWIMGIHAGYTLTRYGNHWVAILPSGLTIFIIHSYDSILPFRTWYLLAYIFFTLLFVARVVYVRKLKRWKKTKTSVPPYLGWDIIRITLLVTVLLLLFTWTIPALADSSSTAQTVWQKVKQPWNNFRNFFTNALASVRASVGIVSDYYGSEIDLSQGSPLKDIHIFSVVAPPVKVQTSRYYWRARIYDNFEDGSWTSSHIYRRFMSPQDLESDPLHPIEKPANIGTFSFTIAQPIATLFTVYQTTWVSRPVNLEFLLNPDSSLDLASMRASPFLNAGDTYKIQAVTRDITISDLKESGTTFPNWVTNRYLHIPESISSRTIDLAEEITAEEETQYDKVNAVTKYLRSNIEYTETVPPIPKDQDILDWFLFDLKQGFCNYYASAEIILLRAVGIPARLAAGYAQGTLSESPNIYKVRQMDAHAWPEVYFPDIGWVEFEPTASQPVLIRPLGVSMDLNDRESENQDTSPDSQDDSGFEHPLPEDDPALDFEQQSQSPSVPVISIVLGLSLIAIILFSTIIIRRTQEGNILFVPKILEKGFHRFGIRPPDIIRRWSRRLALPPIARAYLEISNALSRLGDAPIPSDTPSERKENLSTILPVVNEAAQDLIREYQTDMYSQYKGDIQIAHQAGVRIRNISFRTLIMRVLNRDKSDTKYN